MKNCRQRTTVNLFTFIILFLFSTSCLFGAARTAKPTAHKSKKSSITRKSSVVHRASAKRRSAPAHRRPARRVPTKRLVVSAQYEPNTMDHFMRASVAGGPWKSPTYADSTAGDYIDGEDLNVRRAAVDALGPYNGSVVVVDPSTGRILTMVNQKLALSGGFQPCSTIKVPVSLAALSEGLITRTAPILLYGRTRMAMTEALAKSNNHYFANLGVRLGYERFAYYAKLFGYGERTGLDIPGEQTGYFPAAPPYNGGVGMLTSYGETIRQTPLQLAAIMAAIANGGTLYYLQYPVNQFQVQDLTPRVKRQLDIKEYIPDVLPGMLGAVMFGTARRAGAEESIAGKTGTCTDANTHLGWFGAFNYAGERKLAVSVMLTGGRGVSGGPAAKVAGEVFRRLAQESYFVTQQPVTPAALVSASICCASGN
jgi:beta-lactamase class D